MNARIYDTKEKKKKKERKHHTGINVKRDVIR